MLAEIDPIPYKSRHDEAAAALERAKADLLQLKAKHDLSERQWKRAQDLRSSKNISDTDYEAFETEYKTAKASLAGGQAAVQQAALVLERAETNLSYTVIKSPSKA